MPYKYSDFVKGPSLEGGDVLSSSQQRSRQQADQFACIDEGGYYSSPRQLGSVDNSYNNGQGSSQSSYYTVPDSAGRGVNVSASLPSSTSTMTGSPVAYDQQHQHAQRMEIWAKSNHSNPVRSTASSYEMNSQYSNSMMEGNDGNYHQAYPDSSSYEQPNINMSENTANSFNSQQNVSDNVNGALGASSRNFSKTSSNQGSFQQTGPSGNLDAPLFGPPLDLSKPPPGPTLDVNVPPPPIGSQLSSSPSGRVSKFHRGRGHRRPYYSRTSSWQGRPPPFYDHGASMAATDGRAHQPSVQLNAKNFNMWRFFHKRFNRSDDEVAEHLFEIHEKFCHRCEERYAKDNRGKRKLDEGEQEASGGQEDSGDETEMTEEEKEMKKLMGFSGFKTSKGAKLKDDRMSTSSFVKTDGATHDDVTESCTTLTETEKAAMASLGYSVFTGKDKSKIPFGAPAVTMEPMAR